MTRLRRSAASAIYFASGLVMGVALDVANVAGRIAGRPRKERLRISRDLVTVLTSPSLRRRS